MAKVCTKATIKAVPIFETMRVLADSCPASKSSGAQIQRNIGTNIKPAPCANAARNDHKANLYGGIRAKNFGCLLFIRR